MNKEEKQIRVEVLKIANDICKSHNCPYGSDELSAEAEKVYKLLYPLEFETDERGVWNGKMIPSAPRNNYPTNL